MQFKSFRGAVGLNHTYAISIAVRKGSTILEWL